MEIKAVIGANYGDEGKGQFTAYFANKVKLENKNAKVLNVLTNGGAQRGHTVWYANGTITEAHVFHNLGSATLHNADTYIAKTFMLNPITLLAEIKELRTTVAFHPSSIFIDDRCRFTTPFDMMMSQIRNSSDSSHKSCGMGIWETYTRYRDTNYNIFIKDFIWMSDQERREYLRNIRQYYFEIIKSDQRIYENFDRELFFNENIIQNFIEDVDELLENVEFIHSYQHLKITPLTYLEDVYNYDLVVFENAQGLLLNWSDDPELKEFTTPSKTGIEAVIDILCENSNYFLSTYKDQIDSFEVCYVTRTFITRHGDGPFPYMLLNYANDKETNITNEWQGSLKAGMLKIPEMLSRVQNDFKLHMKYNLPVNLNMSLGITFCDMLPEQHNNILYQIQKDNLPFHNIYSSTSVYDEYCASLADCHNCDFLADCHKGIVAFHNKY